MNLAIKNIKSEQISYQAPLQYFTGFSNKYYSTLMTGRGEEDISRYSVIGVFPHSIIRYNNGFFKIETQTGITEIKKFFWDFLNRILLQTEFDKFDYPANLCGGIGYVSYEVRHKIEKIRKTTIDTYFLPLIEWVFYNVYYIFDNLKREAWQIEVDYKEQSRIDEEDAPDQSFSVKNIETECTKEEYQQKVERIRNYIFAGDVYEVNLSQQIRGEFSGNAFRLFQKLFSLNDAPFSSYLNFGKRKIISNSPELYLRCFDREVETRPIKGTIKRSVNKLEERQNIQTLLNSEKDQAELYMIIDLLRNDLGKVCEFGSIMVENPKRLETYKNVYHLVGIIRGMLCENISYFDLIKATFPGGSITGCPKVRCMEIIDELETFTRNLYTGTIFLMNKKYFNSNIVIRTALIQEGNIFINSGGAVTIDSNPEEEYDEMKQKVKNIFQSLEYE